MPSDQGWGVWIVQGTIACDYGEALCRVAIDAVKWASIIHADIFADYTAARFALMGVLPVRHSNLED